MLITKQLKRNSGGTIRKSAINSRCINGVRLDAVVEGRTEHGEVDKNDGIHRLERIRRQTERYSVEIGSKLVLYAGMEDEPQSIKEALSGKNAEYWREACELEIKSLKDNRTWDLVEKPDGQNIVGCKWVFKVKLAADGNIDRFKARLVAQVYSQEGIDYNEVFAPLAKYKSIWTLLAICNQFDLTYMRWM